MVIEYFDRFIKKCSDSLSRPEIYSLKNELGTEFHRVLTLALQNLNLVTRHEFDIQARVLATTRDKLEKLEQKVLILESKMTEVPKTTKPLNK